MDEVDKVNGRALQGLKPESQARILGSAKAQPCYLLLVEGMTAEGTTTLLQQPSASTLRFKYGNGFGVEGNELFCSEPFTFIGDNSVGKISTGIKGRQSGFNGWPIGHDAGAVSKPLNCVRHVGSRFPVSATEYPYKFAKNGNGNGNQVGFLQQLR